MRRAVFLDRDGTINEEVEYLDNLADLKLIDGAARAIRMLNQAGIPVIVITNQSGVARGLFPLDFVDLVHGEISKILKEGGARIDRWYFCPHHPEAGQVPFRKRCTCRKPGTAMLEKAAQELGLDLKASYLVGDSFSDLETARRAGTKRILVLTGHGRKTREALSEDDLRGVNYIAPDLQAASEWITGDMKK